MGCDIHMTVEKYVNDKWITVKLFDWCYDINGSFVMNNARSRNYLRFAALAGVRGKGPKPLGIPYDVSETTKYLIDSFGVDGHSHSYLGLKEATKIFVETEWRNISNTQKEKMLNDFPYNYFFQIDEEEDLYQYRLVFWFDN